MRRRKFATVYTGVFGEGTMYYATLREARESKSRWGDGTEAIEACDVVALPPRQLAALLLGGESWCVHRVEIEPDTSPEVPRHSVVLLGDEA